MSEIFKPLSNEIYSDWINAIIAEKSDKLTMWEITFVEDMKNKLIARNCRLTERQHIALEAIYAEKTK